MINKPERTLSDKSFQLALAYLQLDEVLNTIYLDKIIIIDTKQIVKREYFGRLTDLNS